jgi:carboxyl-terminal processing protease
MAMKSIIIATLLVTLTTFVFGQNPVTMPKDTTLSFQEKNFETLWLTFEEHYAFFKLRNIDWKKTYQQYRPTVNANTSDDELFEIFSKMLAPFQDNHINVIIPSKKQFKSTKPSTFIKEFPTDSLRQLFWTMVDQTLAKNGFGQLKYAGAEYNGKPLFSYSTSKKYAYLRFNRCFVSEEEENSKLDAEAASKLLDSVFLNFTSSKTLIIDVRDNIGGNDEFSYEVAGRFAEKKSIGMFKKNRKGGYEDFGETETWYIEPKGKPNFLKPVIVLTNDKTVSAGDVFALIMKEIPKVKIIGENTRGIYSDMYGFELPNKWLISLSNQRYYNVNMICYEGSGTPVDIIIKNKRQDLDKMTDPIIIKALNMAKKKSR